MFYEVVYEPLCRQYVYWSRSLPSFILASILHCLPSNYTK